MVEHPLYGAKKKAPRFSFIKRGQDEYARIPDSDFDWDKAKIAVQTALTEALSAKNVSFLLGAGCSSYKSSDGRQLGIPVMSDLSSEFMSAFSVTPKCALLNEFLRCNITQDFSMNLERFIEILHSARLVLSLNKEEDEELLRQTVNDTISDIQKFVWAKCNKHKSGNSDQSVLDLYESFYRKLVFRDRSLPRPWIFTTNYDLFNETAMDRLGLPYTNGFSGVVERRFNPAVFRYTIAEQLDLTNRKWSAVDGYIYLCKLHGSISWTEDDHGLFPIREVVSNSVPSKVMIYPTPAKQNASLASPYADLFREFQSQVVREQSVLVTIGYAFGDEHLNKIIYQALTIPTFRLIIFGDPNAKGDIETLKNLNDPRIWIIGGEGKLGGEKAHYFSSIVEEFMPERPPEKIDDAIKGLLGAMKRASTEAEGNQRNDQ